ncbi:MAG: hypothetical protein FD165_2303 [Gammaproteobacteria bacterium]|nr:MAG: hypothetical protein FD165_2303 [Gammaproteobacteria bacterium]TND02621.1 MAG: hypothetical protein FD120_2082 [Gammaproteobacteria bacterium]
MIIDVETELDHCVEVIDGRLVRDLVGASPNFHNADYLFDEFEVVAELKILSVDQMHEPKIRDKMSDIYREASARGEAEVVVYGEAMITAGNLSANYSKKMGEVYRRPVQNIVKKANKQIRQTKRHLNRHGHSGLLILVNDNHRALEPTHVNWILQSTLRNRNYSSINSILYCTTNITARHPELDTDFLVWMEQHRSGLKPCADELLKRIREAWFRRMSEITGEAIPSYRLTPDAMAKLGHEFK